MIIFMMTPPPTTMIMKIMMDMENAMVTLTLSDAVGKVVPV